MKKFTNIFIIAQLNSAMAIFDLKKCRILREMKLKLQIFVKIMKVNRLLLVVKSLLNKRTFGGKDFFYPTLGYHSRLNVLISEY